MRLWLGVFMLLLAPPFAIGQATGDSPYLYLTSQPKDKALESEIAESFLENCQGVHIAEVQSDADYHIVLTNIDGSHAQKNQLLVTDFWGTPLKKAEGSVARDQAKSACTLIIADWSDQALTRKKYLDAINSGFRKDGLVGFAEIVAGDNLIVHSELANRMRLFMLLANNKTYLLLRRAGIVTFIYTNDADQNFACDVKSGQIDENYDSLAAIKAAGTKSESGAAVKQSTSP